MKYTIQKGDTLSKLAKQYNTTVETLVVLNGIKDENKIRAGDTLTIPASLPDFSTIWGKIKGLFS